MYDLSTVFVRVRDPLGQLLPNAELSLELADKKAGSVTFSYDEDQGLFVSPPVPPGEHVLRLTCRGGYLDQELALTIDRPEVYDSVVMGRPDSPYYWRDGRRIYFEQDGQKIGALVQERVMGPEPEAPTERALFAASAKLRPLEAAFVERPVAGLYVFEETPQLRATSEVSLARQLRETPEVFDAGPLLRSVDGPATLLSRFIEVTVEPGITRQALEVLVRDLPLRFVHQNAYDPRLFMLEATDVSSAAELGALPERLLALDGIAAAASLLNTPVQDTVPIIPGDVNFSLQFQSFVTRLPEAWELINPAATPTSFGSADVVVAVHDGGIQTTLGGTAITHPEFAGVVTGGNLSTQPGLNANKVLFTFDFLPNPTPPPVLIVPGNDNPTGSHGSWVAGTISAVTDGATGTVGGAPNTRLASYIRHPFAASQRWDHALDFIAGFDPRWLPGAPAANPYPAVQVFPASFNTGRNPRPGAHILNCSHTNANPLTAGQRQAFQRMTLFGRDRRGTLVFASGGNQDQDSRLTGGWGEDTNVMRVTASSLDLRLEEVRMNYSSFALLGDRVVDFAAPSESQNVSPTVHQAPQILGFITVDRTTTSGDLPTSVVSRAPLTNSPAAGTSAVQVAAANLASFSAGNRVIVRDTTNPLRSDLQTVAGTVAPNTINLNRPLGFGFTAGSAEIIRLGGTNGYSVQFGGTSAAAPQASAIAALMLSVNPALSWLEVRELMQRTAVPINIRYRGSRYAAAPHFRYRWLTTRGAGPVDLIDADGLLTITGGNKTIAVGPLTPGTRFLTLNNIAGIQPKQALLIGAETKLNGAHPLATPNVINVDRNNEFDLGDTLFIGKNSQTVVISPAAAAATVVWVQSVDGFVPGDDITLTGSAGSETVRIVSVVRMTSPPGLGQPANFGAADTGFNITRLNGAGNPIGGGLANAYARGDLVAIASTQFEGPFTVNGKPAGSLSLNNPVTRNHPDNRIVWKQGTEVKAVIRVLTPTNQVEIDPLDFNHPFNAGGIEHVRVGQVAGYSLAFGHGRLDALEAVRAARNYSHNERDLVIRNFLADDGVNNRAAQEVESPDVWVRNDAATAPGALPYGSPGPHQHPEITIDPAIFIGAGINDLEVSGNCTSAAEVTLTIEIDTAAATDRFKWNKNGGATTAGVAITGATQIVSDGVSIRFPATTGHTLGDRWIVKARRIVNRFLHVRTFNRGTLTSFANSALSGGALDVARSRILLAASDGFPVCRFSSVATPPPGVNDLEVVTAYTGANPRALYTVEITAVAAGGDTFRWHRDGTPQPPVALTAATLLQPLNDGVQVLFGSHTGHKVGDRWDIYARSGAANDPFLNIDHAWEFDEALPFILTSNTTGSRLMAENPISGLAPATALIHNVAWPEATRPPTNSPNALKPTRPIRLFAIGEAVPHDGVVAGALSSFTAKTNNNFSFRELIFAKFRFVQGDAVTDLEGHIDVDSLGTQITKTFRAEVRTTAGTFTAESARIRLTAKKTGGVDETVHYRFDTVTSTWGFDPAAPAWATLNPPNEARRPDATEPVATGEQFDINFNGTYKVDKSFISIELEPQILSSFRAHVVAKALHTVNVYEEVLLPTGVDLAQSATVPKPVSHVFADLPTMTQNAQQAFGPVDDPADPDSLTTRYRATSLFRSPIDVKAYAVVDGFVAVQRDPLSNDTVNLILRPLNQPIAGFTPVRYFIYRGLRLGDFLAGTSAVDEKKIRPKAGASPFLTGVWTVFEMLNPGVVEMPSTVLGYDPANQNAGDSLDSLFFQVGGAMQLPLARKGTELGFFHNNGGASDFGFEIVLEEGGQQPDLAFARRAVNEIDISALPNGSPTDRFARRIAQDEILNYLDPAAFYGLHMHDGGRVELPGGGALAGQDIFTQVLSRFHTRHKLYVDIRCDSGSSLNFHQNYDDGSGNQVQTAIVTGLLTPRPYATHGWPILIIDVSAPSTSQSGFNDFGLKLRVNDNEKGVVYVDHGQLLTPATNGAFVRGSELRSGTDPWTETIAFRFPNTGPPGASPGVAWVLRLFYGRLENPAPTAPLPNTVLKTETYADNVFGPIDRGSRWAGTPGLLWLTTQDKRYVDATSVLGWKQMMECGMALQTAAVSRMLLYAVVNASDGNDLFNFVPIRGITDGVSSRASFFDERGLFGVYLLEHDQIDDAGTTVRTLRLLQHPDGGYPPTNAVLLGLEKTQFDTLKALTANGISGDYLRNLRLDSKTTQVDANGKSYDRYRVGIQGLRTADGEYQSEFPAVDINVYSVDGHMFCSKAFTDAEPLPTVYARTYEEEKGTRQVPARERRIASVDAGANTVTIDSFDWRREIVIGDSVKIDKSAGNNGQFPVANIVLNGNGDTVLTLGGAGVANNTAPLGSVFTVPKAIEDIFIDLDQGATMGGIPKTRDLVTTFATQLAAIANNAGALASIRARVNDAAPKILRRARLRAQADRTHADDHERTLYWARLRMLVILKSHPFCLASISGRNELVELFERHSRGYGLDFAGAPGGARKILITGFDPFALDKNLESSNPSAAAALAFHGQTITSSGKNAYVEAAIFPVRYRDMDAGRVETLVNPRLAGAGRVDMILNLSQQSENKAHFDLDRLAGRRRGGAPDNAYARPVAGTALGVDATHNELYETNLPVAVLAPGPFATPPAADQKLFFDESYEATGPDSSHKHPLEGGTNGNAASFALASVAGKAASGSAGAFLANEIFYRVAQRRTALASTTLTGHLQVPAAKTAGVGVDKLIEDVEKLIKRWLDSLP